MPSDITKMCVLSLPPSTRSVIPQWLFCEYVIIFYSSHCFKIPDLHCYFKYLGTRERVFERKEMNPPTSRRIIFTVPAFFICCSIFVVYYFARYIISILFSSHHQERMQVSFRVMLPTLFTSLKCHIRGMIWSLTADASVSSAALSLPISSNSYFK